MIAGTTQAVFVQLKDDAAPPPPPDTWGAYQKKDGKSNGVISLMEMLIKELQTGITESKHEEDTAQEAAKADLDAQVESTKSQKASQEAELANIKGYIAELHANCDFLLENYDLRKAARANEAESLKNAKGVLSGANFA